MSFGKFNNNNNKKKTKKQKSKPNTNKNSEQTLLQFSEFENDDKTTTDAEFLNKKPIKPSLAKKQPVVNNNPNSNIILDFDDNNIIDDSKQIQTKRQPQLPPSTFINTDDFDLSLSDNDIDYGQEEMKDTSLKPSSSTVPEPKVTFSKIKEKQSKSNSIIPTKKPSAPNHVNEVNHQKMKSQGKKEISNNNQKPKKKAGSEMTMQSYGSSSKTQDLIEKNIQLSSDITNVGRNALSNSFYYNDEKMLQINSLLSNMIQFIKSNPYYIFASSVATACSKNETYFIRNTAQELIKIITSNGRNAISSSGLDKSFEQQLGVLKSINFLLSSMNTGARFVTGPDRGTSRQSSIDIDTSSSIDISSGQSGEIVSDAEKLLRENLTKIRILQTEIDAIRNIIIKGNIFLSLEFYLSQDLISLVNSVITNVQLLPDDNGIISTRTYNPNKIIELQPMIRNKLAELCALTFSNYGMINASRPTTKFLHVSSKNIYNENMLLLKKMLEANDDVLDDGYNTPVFYQPNMDYYNYLSPSPYPSPYEPTPQPTTETETILTRPPVSEEESPFTPFSPSGFFGFERSQAESKKKRMIASSKKYYSVPKRFRI